MLEHELNLLHFHDDQELVDDCEIDEDNEKNDTELDIE